jgi:tetratricopeptide (TPR) repeat protein
MKAPGLAFLLAAQALQFQITDGRCKRTSSVTIEAGAPDADGWRPLTVKTKARQAKGAEPVLVWPFDGSAKLPDGPEPIPAIVVQRGEQSALANKQVVAAVATPVVLGVATLEQMAGRTGLAADALAKAFSALASSADPFERGVGLLYSGKSADAAGLFAIALKQRQRQLTRVPSEIYAAAVLYGQALYQAGKFDDAAVAFLTALKERPDDSTVRKHRADALVKAGKPEAAER